MKIKLGIIALCLFALALAGCKEKSLNDSVVYLRKAMPQTQTERNIVGAIPGKNFADLNEHLIENALVDTLVYEVWEGYLWVDSLYIFVMDRGDWSVKKYSKIDGQFIQRYSKGKGKGPGEIQALSGFRRSADGEIGVVDPRLRRLTIFDEDSGEVISTINIDSLFHTSVLDASLDKLVLSNISKPHNFEIYQIDRVDKKLALLATDGEWAKGQEGIYGPDVDGLVVQDPSEDAYYYMTGPDGWIYGGTFSGEELYLRRTIDGNDLAVSYQGAEKVPGVENAYWSRIDKSTLQVLYNVWDKKIYALVWLLDSDKNFMDVYNARNGDYIESFEINYTDYLDGNAPLCVHRGIFDGDLYFVCDGINSFIISRYPLERFRFSDESRSQ